MPSGLNFTREYQGINYTTVTLEWDPPQGSGQEAIVDNYTISVFPRPLSHPSINVVMYPPWNVTLDHSRVYSINITAVNCAGGETLEVEYSKYKMI